MLEKCIMMAIRCNCKSAVWTSHNRFPYVDPTMNTITDGFEAEQADAPVMQAPIEQLSGTSSQASLPVARVVVTCSSCKATLSVRRVYVGNAVACKQCGHIFTVPSYVEAAPISVVDRTIGRLPGRPSQAEVDVGVRNQRPGGFDMAALNQLVQIISGGNDLRTAYDRLQAEQSGLRANQVELGARLESVASELNAIRASLGSISATDVRSLAAERDQLSAVVQALREENRDLHSSHASREGLISQLSQARADHVVELEKLSADLAELRSRHLRLGEEHCSAGVLCKQLQERNEELVAAGARHESEYQTLLATERALRAQLTEEVVALRANAEETARVAELLISGNLNHLAGAPVAPACELEAARVQAEELKNKLEEADSLYRVMTETLHGIGIHIDLPIRNRERLGTDLDHSGNRAH
jgi:ribosomal protein L37AE/L43A